MRFSWDPKKAAANILKHGVSFHEAATVLEDPLSTTYPDPDHSIDEQRFLTIGVSVTGRALVASNVQRGATTLRIISARKAIWRELAFHEQG